ncbi:hypothetical protein K505DRAFT_359605 [Melanomma pulvis-pyrius CBS 109.77]|uniref:Aminoglycoside phosphotransferase domain-containing protein n=1 Tax=Melanomma pulvis-pyrius CBS 109.77 TaxID=1314802 RepID=A0A6A6XHU7_9PLEO|nr:hypothetical protein K505DRAFT_359605 [Melanomma pulvis-pyrius CBS 109.77]
MSDYDVPTPQELLQSIYGKTEYLEVSDAIRERSADFVKHHPNRSSTALAPSYLAQGPFETPIPTVAEIAAIFSASGEEKHCYKRVGPYLVEVGYHTYKQAENLIYLAANSSVRIPKLYAAGTFKMPIKDQEGPPIEHNYIVREYIEGERLRKLKEDEYLSKDIQKKIGKLLGEQIRRLRIVPAEVPGHFGRINGKPFTGLEPFLQRNLDSGYFRPFTYEGLVESMIQNIEIDEALELTLFEKSEYPTTDKMIFSSIRPTLINNQIIVKLVRNKEGKAVDVEEVAIADWDDLYWMPSWFQPGVVLYLDLEKSSGSIFNTAFLNMGPVNLGPVSFWGTSLNMELALRVLHYEC